MNPDLLNRILDGEVLVPLVIASVFVVWIVGDTIRKVVDSLARERSRREIAAYIAEGSMTPEQGQKLMAAARPDRKNS